jgi:hypothetical protein
MTASTSISWPQNSTRKITYEDIFGHVEIAPKVISVFIIFHVIKHTSILIFFFWMNSLLVFEISKDHFSVLFSKYAC